MRRITAACLAMLVALILWASPVLASEFVVEMLRLDVPAAQRQIWLEAEASTWQPWLERQDGFLGRDLDWDPRLEQGLLLIRWASRAQWKAIEADAVDQVQQQFDSAVNSALGREVEAVSAFPLLEAAELLPQRLIGRSG